MDLATDLTSIARHLLAIAVALVAVCDLRDLAAHRRAAAGLWAPSRSAGHGSGPAVGGHAPGFALRDLRGRKVTIDDLQACGVPTVLVFLQPRCAASIALAKAIGDRKVAEGPPTDRRIVAVVGGTPEAAAERIDSRGFTHVLVDEAHVVTERYEVAEGPAAVVVLADGRVGSPLVRGPDAISDLLRPAPARTDRRSGGAGLGAAGDECGLAHELVLVGAIVGDH